MAQRISSVLIANRGEIAVRITRACRELGLRAVALYTEIDRDALHVATADEAYPIDNYLDMRGIVAVAKRAKADAIHPGYGFLAENARFAAAAARAGLVFVGPPAAVIRRMGSKISARQLAVRAGVPIVPGTTAPLGGLAEAKRVAARIGYPVLLKAAFGGGGKGMRIAKNAAELAAGFRLAAAEATAAFGDGALYIEKYLERPRHIEVQLLADHEGNVLHCFERECSIQRRHQKVIEETPAPFLDAATRAAICNAAVRFARAGRYRNAGTVEFLVDRRRRFYFLEMNTRIQVEHPITEWIAGIDLVKMQLAIAMGKPLPWRQSDLAQRGHAVECRIYAENPFADFFPSPGTITALIEPQGPGVRMDTGVTAGSLVPIHYDPILGKLSTWGATRAEAIARMRRALREYRVAGIVTNIAFHRRVLAHPAFRTGRYDITFVERHERGLTTITSAERDHAIRVAAVAGTLKAHGIAASGNAAATPSPWMLAARREGVERGLAC
ncbi:MAG: acetyl-CoA carboxylase biotin carboxylase subunit [Deltaproteobacteria bacterium]|nr:acetyl-CoA carboxylase biotin carboxylase subunit [Deltaproteobacteria bacterium]